MTHPDPLRQNVALDALNTLRLPARAAWFAAIDSVDTLRAVLDDARIQGPPIGTNTTGQEAEGPHCVSGGSH